MALYAKLCTVCDNHRRDRPRVCAGAIAPKVSAIVSFFWPYGQSAEGGVVCPRHRPYEKSVEPLATPGELGFGEAQGTRA